MSTPAADDDLKQDNGANELSESGLQPDEAIMEEAEAEDLHRRRQETVSFELDETEISFNAYRAIIEDRQGRCYLQT